MIRPKYIRIQNFNNIIDTSLDLSSAVSLFIGDNGSGKTSVVDAIGLCLFEYKRSDTYADYINSDADSAHIYFECDIANDPITFDITIHKTGSTALEREVNFQGEVYHNSEVSALLERLNLKYFSNIFCSMQNDKDITKLSPTERVTYIQKLLAFSFAPQIKVVDDNIKQLTDNITQLSTTNTALAQTIQNLEKQIKPLNNLDNLYGNIDEVKAKLEELLNKRD
jgi:DNA repair exonuclease SbcCD ATPase subunit